jgi:epsin
VTYLSDGCVQSQALQLLEYLVKHGSERVVDDARSHISTLKMLRSFHYIDEKGKDQGAIGNVFLRAISQLYVEHSHDYYLVRNRAKELVELLADVERIRQERKKAEANRSKYVGTGNDGFSFGGSGRYGRFGSESLGSYSGDYGGSARGYDRGG